MLRYVIGNIDLQARKTQPLIQYFIPVEEAHQWTENYTTEGETLYRRKPRGSPIAPMYLSPSSLIHTRFFPTWSLHTCSSICLEYGFPCCPYDWLLLIIHVSISKSSQKKDILDVLTFRPASIILLYMGFVFFRTFMKFHLGIMTCVYCLHDVFLRH